mgnify:CR=1 FL=1
MRLLSIDADICLAKDGTIVKSYRARHPNTQHGGKLKCYEEITSKYIIESNIESLIKHHLCLKPCRFHRQNIVKTIQNSSERYKIIQQYNL